MSWSINHIGTRAAVTEKVANNVYLPPDVKQVILNVLNDSRPNLPNGVKVEGFGHQSDGTERSHYSNIGKLEIQPISLDL